MNDHNNDAWADTEPRMISRAEQEQTGLARRNAQSAYVQPTRAYEITNAEQALLSNATTAAGEMIAHRQMTHIARSDDTAVTHAVASLVYSAAYIVLIALITIGIVLMALYLFDGEGSELFALAGLIGWGWVSMRYLKKNRAQGLHHSATGIAHHEIDSRENIAIHAIDKHVEFLERRAARHDRGD